MTETFGLLGGGSQADETEEYALPGAVAFRAVTSEYLLKTDRYVDIATAAPELLAVPVVAAVGAPGLRRRLVSLWSGVHFHTIVAPGAVVGRSARVGAGCVVAPGAVVTYNATLGNHVLVNVGATVSHATVLGDYVTVSPGANIAGDCVVGDGVFVGIGAVVSHGVRIAPGTVLGAGAVVVSDITEPGVYVGVPAQRLRDTDGWIEHL